MGTSKMPLKWMTLIPFLLLAGCKAQLHHGLDESEANTLQNALREHGIEAAKVAEKGKKPTWAIEVSDEDAHEAQRILTELELPRIRLPGLAALAESGSMVPTPTEEHLKKVKALSEEIALTLQSVDGVTSARVLLALPPPARPGQPPGQAKASAFLRVRPGGLKQLEPMRAEMGALVAGSVEGLTADQVTVVLQEIVRPVRPPREASPGASLRVLLVILAATVSVLALALVGLTLRLRAVRRRGEKEAPPPAAAPRPVVAPAAARKVA